MKSFLASIAALILLCAGSFAAAPSVVSVKTIPPSGGLEPGKPLVLTIELQISKPYHINSNRPLQDYLIPTTLELEPQPGFRFGEPVFPEAPARLLPVSDSPMAVYDGTVRVSVEVVPESNAGLSDITVKGKVRYQACDDTACLPPVQEPFSLTLPVMTSSLRSSLAPAPDPGTEQNPAFPGLGDKGLLATFLLVFLGGLALNLTPCVYPMIPITITYFGGQAEGKKGSVVFHSVLYVTGMAVTYSVLGVAAAMTGGLFGAALQYPAVLIGIAAVMVLLALSMFDVYEMRLPGFMNRLAGGSQKGFWGTFLMGLTVGIVAAPCIGPFVLGLLTYVGNKGNVLLGFGLFFVLSIGLGIPFLILAAFSGSIHRLPRSGAWMVWVRKVFGFVLLAMAVYFLKPLFSTELGYYMTMAVILFLAGIYAAWIDPVPAAGKGFVLLRNAVGAAFFAVALYAAVTGIEDRLAGARITDTSNTSGALINWLPYSDEVLKQAVHEGKPVLLDFYADWCAPCKELDKHTFSVKEVVEKSREFVMVKVDLTSSSDPQAEFLRKKYRALGVPTLVFLHSDGQEIEDLRGTGFESGESMLRKMSVALAGASAKAKQTMSVE